MDGSVTVGGDSAGSLTFENATLHKVELNVATKLFLKGDTNAASVVIPDAAVEGTAVVLQDNGVIGDIVVPDKQLVQALVQDFSVNQGKIRLVNGQPIETETGTSSPSQPTLLYAIPIAAIQEAGEGYTLPTQVSVRLSNASTVKRNVEWHAPEGVAIENGQVLINAPAVYTFSGTVQGFAKPAELKVDVRLPLKLELVAGYQTVSATVGQSVAFAFTSEPVVEVTTSVKHIAYKLRWFDETGANVTSEVELTDAGGLNKQRLGDSWVVSAEGSHAVAGKETISVKVQFGHAGTYTLRAAAIKYNPA